MCDFFCFYSDLHLYLKGRSASHLNKLHYKPVPQKKIENYKPSRAGDLLNSQKHKRNAPYCNEFLIQFYARYIVTISQKAYVHYLIVVNGHDVSLVKLHRLYLRVDNAATLPAWKDNCSASRWTLKFEATAYIRDVRTTITSCGA